MTSDEIKKLLRETSRLAPPWEVRKIAPFGWEIRSTRWAAPEHVVACLAGIGADGDARLIAAAPALAEEVLRLRALVRRMAHKIANGCTDPDCPGGDFCWDALLSEARKAAT